MILGEDIPMDKLPVWLKKVNDSIGRHAKRILRERSLNKQFRDQYLSHLKDGREFYRLEFDWCDLDKDDFLSTEEIIKCEEKKAKIMIDRMRTINNLGSIHDGTLVDTEFPVKIDLRRLLKSIQRKRGGFTFKYFVRAKIFYAEIWARTLMEIHDLNKQDGKICPDEWWHVAQQHRRMLRGYAMYGLEEIWEDYRHVDMNPYTYVLEMDELRWVLDIIRRKWIQHWINIENKS